MGKQYTYKLRIGATFRSVLRQECGLTRRLVAESVKLFLATPVHVGLSVICFMGAAVMLLASFVAPWYILGASVKRVYSNLKTCKTATPEDWDRWELRGVSNFVDRKEAPDDHAPGT